MRGIGQILLLSQSQAFTVLKHQNKHQGEEIVTTATFE